MVDLNTLKAELTVIVNDLAKAVVTGIFNTAEKVTLKKQNPEMETLRSLVDSWCVEAVEKILNAFQLFALKNEKGPKIQKDPVQNAEGSLKTTEGEDSGAEPPPPNQTFILVYGSAPVDSHCVLLSLQSNANEETNHEIKTEAPGEVTALQTEHPTSSLPSQGDHEYARPSSPPPPAFSAVKRRISKTGGRKFRQSKHKKTTNAPETEESTETLPRCFQCGMLFPNAERLSDHQRKSHPMCLVCGKTFTGILRLREHEIKDHRLQPYACEYCPKRFNHKPHLNLHIKCRHTGEKSCHCDICGKGYSSISMLKTHKMTHFEKKFTCDVCGRSFYHACHLTRHKLVHEDVRPHKCSTCGKGFTQAANLRSHQATHTGERQLCSICGKSYRCLKYHIISKHPNELSANELPATDAIVSCAVCSKKFPNQSQLRVHQRVHTGEKPFHCDVCGKSYRLKELLRDHKYTHTGEKPYKCSHCSKTFNLATSFIRHRSIHSGTTPYSCQDCGKHFRLLTFLKAHLQTKAHLKQTQKKSSNLSEMGVNMVTVL
ncbi:zinc finger protein 708-like [Cheilinus undulatus]|uniref:zinc finger protein 708-like n=1 Tax=Cheilinus undulatus TaxID=241271 RepID=UPI001BD6CBA3|nr:zinc finger protein 708-like [Cheilinus undulatus]